MKVNRLQSNCKGQLVSAGVVSCSNAWCMMAAHIMDIARAYFRQFQAASVFCALCSELLAVHAALACTCRNVLLWVKQHGMRWSELLDLGCFVDGAVGCCRLIAAE